MLAKKYFEKINQSLSNITIEQIDNIGMAADLIADSLEGDSLVHVFGGGHSHIIAEEVFFRAGGLVPINPILDSITMLHGGAVKSSTIEKQHGLGKVILDNYQLERGEVIVVISNSGINPLPIEVAIAAKEKGLKVITISAHIYFEKASRHESGKHLSDFADVAIDNMLPMGDSLIHDKTIGIEMGPGSTIVGTFIINSLMLTVAEALYERGIQPPVFKSSNDEGGAAHNAQYIEDYRKRIKHL